MIKNFKQEDRKYFIQTHKREKIKIYIDTLPFDEPLSFQNSSHNRSLTEMLVKHRDQIIYKNTEKNMIHITRIRKT